MVLPAILAIGGVALGATAFFKNLNAKVELAKQATAQEQARTEQIKNLPKGSSGENITGLTPSPLDDWALILKRFTPVLLIIGGVLVVYFLMTKR